MRSVRGCLPLVRNYSHAIWFVHLAALTTVLTVMVYLHNSTCSLDTPDIGQVRSEGEGHQGHHIAKRHVMSLTPVTLPESVATANGTLPDIARVVSLTPGLTEFLSRPIINRMDNPYLHNPTHKCQDREVQFVVVIPSARYNFDQRRKIRLTTLRHFMLEHGDQGAMVFFLGVPPPELRALPSGMKNQAKIDQEARQHQDIVQQDYMDTHRTLTTKSMAMLHWVNTYCSNAKYVIKLDDDIRFDTDDFLSLLERTTGGRERAILGQIYYRATPVSRDQGDRFFVSHREYPKPVFPPYVMGGLLAYPMSTARLLLEGVYRIPPIPLDDIYVTGLVARALNISLVSDPEFTFQHHSCGAIRL